MKAKTRNVHGRSCVIERVFEILIREINYLGELGVDERIILKRVFKK
jgi:hypothetical protein